VGWRSLANKRLLGYLSWRRRRRFVHRRDVLDEVMADLATTDADGILVSGDLTHVGLPSECESARRWLESVAPPDRLTLVPGNHDRYVADDWAETVGRWRAYVGDAAEGWPRVVRRDGVVIVALDCAVPTAPFLATGRLGGEQIARLREVLAAAGAAGEFRLIVLHHSPLPRGHGFRKRLVDARALMAVLDDAGAEMVVHGHGHRERVARVGVGAGEIVVVAAPSASDATEGRAGWNRYVIEAAHDGWSIEITARRRGERGMSTGYRETIRLARPGGRA
jgi:3',5'-cyclic AMP phosphodiesterase CpdA